MKPLFPGRRFSFLRLFIAILCIALVASGTWSWITFTRTAAKKLPEPWFGGYVDVTAIPSYEFESKVGNVYRNVILGFVTAGDGCSQAGAATTRSTKRPPRSISTAVSRKPTKPIAR